MSTPRLALATAVAVGLTTIASPAHAATLGERTTANECRVTLTADEQRFARQLFDDRAKFGEHERGRDEIAAIEKVFPAAKPVGDRLFAAGKPKAGTVWTIAAADRAGLEKAGLGASLIDAYANAHLDQLWHQPIKNPTDVTKEDIDLANWKVKADSSGANQSARIATVFPVKDPSTVDKETLAKLTDAWVATPTGEYSKRENAFNSAQKQAAQACALGTSKVVAFPEQQGDLTGPGLGVGSVSSEGSRFDVIAGAVITIVVAIAGLIAAVPQIREAFASLLPKS